jgi:hypothetical protein
VAGRSSGMCRHLGEAPFRRPQALVYLSALQSAAGGAALPLGRVPGRTCCGLAYGSELELKGYRGQWRAQKIQVRLGGEAHAFDFPNRPRYMHGATYERAPQARGCCG